jgi:formate dehydrogenase gamma subunit
MDKQTVRFTPLHRLEHWIFMASFTLLGITGLVQKYSFNPISERFIQLLGGLDNVRLVHHVAAAVMMLVTIYHIGAVGYRMYVLRLRPTMLPSLADLQAALSSLKYYIGRDRHLPQQGRYTFEEKAEYWAVVWGTVVMAITGFMMWNPISTTRFFSGEVIPAAKVAHGLEAVLAIVAIFLWHFYHVLVKTFNRSMFNGKLNEHQMLEEHPLELADIKAGLAKWPVNPVKKRQRERVFLPVYGVIAALMLVGLYFFVSYEQTAITTIPPVTTEQVFVPLTPTPLPTLLPTNAPAPLEAGGAWDTGVGDLLAVKCGSCHSSAAQTGGLDLSAYQAALAGGESGPAVVPGEPDSSPLFVVQSTGNHPGQLSLDELDRVIEWIKAGAPEN